MRRVAMIGAIMIAWALPALGADGKAIFEENGCGSCHRMDKKVVGPSLQTISSAYGDDLDGMVRFLNGEKDPIVDPAKFEIMRANLGKTKALDAGEREALAKYLLAHD